MLCECKISIKCYDEEIEVAGQVAGQPAAHAKIKPEMDASIVAYSASWWQNKFKLKTNEWISKV